jgi:hypothetical protein
MKRGRKKKRKKERKKERKKTWTTFLFFTPLFTPAPQAGRACAPRRGDGNGDLIPLYFFFFFYIVFWGSWLGRPGPFSLL